MKRITCLVLALLLGALPTAVVASEENSASVQACDAPCGEGERLVSFSDGSSIACHCAPSAEMEETVPDLSLEGVVDPENIS
jgi:hypothetical protein